jgi:GAF domain-containing protein/anti-sigma regulatory factor (Ser/Thr protein kinase)
MGEQRERGQRPLRETAEKFGRLESVTEAALAHLALDDLLEELLTRVRLLLGVDTAAILMLDPERGELVARAAKGLEEEEVERGVRIPLGAGFAGRIAAERRTIALEDVEQGELVNPLLRERGIRSLLGAPLVVEGRVIGIVHVGSLVPRAFGEEEHDLLQRAADRMAIAIDHARLFEAERGAREAAEHAADQLRRLQAITETALAHLTMDEALLNELLARVQDVLEVDTAAVLMVDAEGGELVARAAKGLEEEVERGVRIPLGAGFAGRIAADRRPAVLEDVRPDQVVNPILRERGVRSLLGVPLLVEGNVTGVLHVGTLVRREFTEDDVTLLQLAADRIAVALDRAELFEREHRVAETLQRSLQPERLPDLPGLPMAARYVPGADEGQVGGDWYDVIPLPSGEVGLAMGDVVSRGLRAAAVMGQLRTTLRAYAMDGHPPGVVLSRLGRLVRGFEPREMATLVYLVLDRETGAVRLASAGHPPPLVVESGRARFIEGGRSVPLGAGQEPEYPEVADTLPDGATLLLYTDGLVERRDMWIDEGLRRLAERAGMAPSDPHLLCDDIIDALVGHAPRDDVALLAVRAAAPREPRLELDLPARPDALAEMRRALRQWLAARGAESDETYDALVAVTEAAANAVEHAYGPGDASFRVEADADGPDVTVVVRDFGRWRPPRGRNRGRGTLLMQELMDDFQVATSTDGTEVVLRRTLSASGGYRSGEGLA